MYLHLYLSQTNVFSHMISSKATVVTVANDTISLYRSVTIVMKDIVIDAEGLGIDFRSSYIGHSVTNSSPPLRCFFGAVLPRRLAAEMDPDTRYMLWNNTASIM